MAHGLVCLLYVNSRDLNSHDFGQFIQEQKNKALHDHPNCKQFVVPF